MRENRAVVNAARLGAGAGLLVDTVTDVLRAACALSGGDVTLTEPTRVRSLSRPVRRALLTALDGVVAASPAKLADVGAHREAFKRLGERLRPHEYPRLPHAADVFAVARGEKRAHSSLNPVRSLSSPPADAAVPYGPAASARFPGRARTRTYTSSARTILPNPAGVCRGHRLPARSLAAARSNSSTWQPGYAPNTGNFHR